MSPFNGLATARAASTVPRLRTVEGGGRTNQKSRCQNLHRSHLNSITAFLLFTGFCSHTLIVVNYHLFGLQFLSGDIVQCDIVQNVGTFAGRATTQHGQSQSYTSTVNESTFHFPLCPTTQFVLMCGVFLDVRTGEWLVRASVVIWNIQGPNSAASFWESGSYKEPTIAGL